MRHASHTVQSGSSRIVTHIVLAVLQHVGYGTEKQWLYKLVLTLMFSTHLYLINKINTLHYLHYFIFKLQAYHWVDIVFRL